MIDIVIEWTLKSEDVEWTMDYDEPPIIPGKSGTEQVFEKEKALAHLIINDVVFINNFWYEKTWPADAQRCINCFVNVNDTFMRAADAERLEYSQIEPLYRLWIKDPSYGPVAWAMGQRKKKPLRHIADTMIARGYDLDELIK